MAASIVASCPTVAKARTHVASAKTFQPRAGLRVAKRLVSRPRSVCIRSTTHKVYAATMEEQAKQMKQAEDRWQANVRSGRVRSVSSRELVDMTSNGEWKLLDVRPDEEVELGEVPGSYCVPLFEVDDDMSPQGLLKQMSAFGMGGWWLGGQHMMPNTNFMPQVLNKIPKDEKVVVICQKGLRSLAACEQLSRAGYENIAWLNGGCEAAEAGVIPTIDGKDIRLAGVGGVSGWLGWNPVQQQMEEPSENSELVNNLVKVFVFILGIDVLALAYEFLNAQQ
eukprot:CAMPEP_0118958506 /NCGR_PEP_ID=MMETSP1169-20130426/62651_1 /TAXON_ID=36882 /ORGANISM="Pyramimonas obovata, Strain CCMP722" /LENGTH=279 /DNA_ID=CAMNT_0006906623 /DNA_START=87 /DNA_END=926 /DNA_ORIENTATION=-